MKSRKIDFKNSITLPFMGPISYTLRTYFKRHNIQVIFNSGLSFQRSIFKQTQTHTIPTFIPGTTQYNRKNVIYKIKCSDCDAFYLGQTKRDFNTRFKEHISSIQNNSNTTSLSTHCINNSHNIKFDRFIDTSSDPYLLPILESIHIYKNSSNNNLLNTQRDPKNFILPHIYKSLL